MSRHFVKKPRLSLMVFTLMVSGMACYAEAKDSPQKEKVFGDWGVECEMSPAKEKKCFISQRQVAKEGGKQLLKVSVGYIGPKGEPTLVALVPLGISLPAGVAFKIDNHPQVPLVIQFCTAADGCVASTQLDKNTLQYMMEGKSMLVGMVPSLSDNKTMSIHVSLKGFVDGFASLLRGAP